MLLFLTKAQFFIVSNFLHQVAIFIVIKHKTQHLHCEFLRSDVADDILETITLPESSTDFQENV